MKKLVLIFVSILIIVSCLIGLCACDFSDGDPITSMEFDSLSEEKLGFHGLFGWYGDEYEGYINIQPANYNSKDIEIVCDNPKIAEITIGKKEEGKISYKVEAKYNGVLKIHAQTKDGNIVTSTKKFVISGGSNPSYTVDEKNRVLIQQHVDINDSQLNDVIANLKKVGFDKIDDSSYGWKENGIETILIVCDGLVVDLGLKDGKTEFIRVYSNSSSTSGTRLNLYDGQYIKSISDSERQLYKSYQEKAVKEQIRQQVRSILSITKLVRSKPNSVGGVDVTMGIKNKSSKTIKYFHVGFAAKNAVGDEVYCEVRGSGVRPVKMTGPIASGEAKEAKAQNYWYNSSISKIGINYIHIEYTDGSEIVFDSDMLNALIENYNNGER